MIYEYSAPVMPETYIKTYIARITGPHKTYRLKRLFIERTCHGNRNGNRYFSAEISSRGVYEVCFKYCDMDTDDVLERRRYYFVCKNGEQRRISGYDVLATVEALKRRNSTKR